MTKSWGFVGFFFCKTETTQFCHLCQCRHSDQVPTCAHLNLTFYLLHLGHSHCLHLQTLHLKLVWWCTVLACSLCWTKLQGKKPDFIRTTAAKRRSMFKKKVAHSSLPLLLFMHKFRPTEKSSFCSRALHGRRLTLTVVFSGSHALYGRSDERVKDRSDQRRFREVGLG